MTAEARALTRPSPIARIAGLGSIYGKTVRDSRRAALLVGGVAALFVIATGAPYATSDFGTVEAGARADLLLLAGDPSADLAALKRIDAVIAAGRAYPAAELKTMLERAAAAGRKQEAPPPQ